MITRRGLGKGIGAWAMALLVGASVSLTGCNVFDDILAWVPAGLSALQGILTVLGPLVSPAALAVIVLIKAGFADLLAAVTAYRNDTNPADKATLLAKIRTLLADIVANFQSFLNALNLGSNPIVAVVVGLADVILAAIEGFMGQLPQPITLSAAFHVGTRTFTVTPKLYKRVGEFRRDYNAAAIAGGHPEVKI